MHVLTKAQRRALKSLYDRTPLWARDFVQTTSLAPNPYLHKKRLTYREFRKRVQPSLGDRCIMIPWCGMWLGIETDGYTHS